jgi:hypothetical protein
MRFPGGESRLFLGRARRMSSWLIAIAILIAACALAAWWLLPKRWVERLRDEIPDPKDRADIEDNFRKTVGQLIAGAAVILGACAKRSRPSRAN